MTQPPDYSSSPPPPTPGSDGPAANEEQAVARCSSCGAKQLATPGSITARCNYCGAPLLASPPRELLEHEEKRTQSGGGVAIAVTVAIAIVTAMWILMSLARGCTNYHDPALSPNLPSWDGLPTTTERSECQAARQGIRSVEPGTSLAGCNLSYGNFHRTDLTYADLSFTNVSSADLSYANLSGVNLTGADLTGADLTGANLTGVIWSNTTCPDGSNSDSHGNTCAGYGI